MNIFSHLFTFLIFIALLLFTMSRIIYKRDYKWYNFIFPGLYFLVATYFAIAWKNPDIFYLLPYLFLAILFKLFQKISTEEDFTVLLAIILLFFLVSLEQLTNFIKSFIDTVNEFFSFFYPSFYGYIEGMLIDLRDAIKFLPTLFAIAFLLSDEVFMSNFINGILVLRPIWGFVYIIILIAILISYKVKLKIEILTAILYGIGILLSFVLLLDGLSIVFSMIKNKQLAICLSILLILLVFVLPNPAVLVYIMLGFIIISILEKSFSIVI